MTGPLYRIDVHFGGRVCRRDMPVVPRVGDIVMLDDALRAFRLRVDAVFHVEDKRQRDRWSIRINGTVEDMFEDGERRSFATIPRSGLAS